MDKSGNFKFYMHAGCANVTLMPYAIAQIRSVGCLKQVFGNPLRVRDMKVKVRRTWFPNNPRNDR